MDPFLSYSVECFTDQTDANLLVDYYWFPLKVHYAAPLYRSFWQLPGSCPPIELYTRMVLIVSDCTQLVISYIFLIPTQVISKLYCAHLSDSKCLLHSYQNVL